MNTLSAKDISALSALASQFVSNPNTIQKILIDFRKGLSKPSEELNSMLDTIQDTKTHTLDELLDMPSVFATAIKNAHSLKEGIASHAPFRKPHEFSL